MDQYIEFIVNHYLLSLAFVVVSFLLIQDLIENTFNKFESLSPILAVTRMNGGDVAVVDVRDPHEFVKGHIEDAQNIPLGKLEEQIGTLEPYKSKEVLIVCQSGTRTSAACKTLSKAGFEKLFTLQGGMQSWEDNNFPIKISSKK